MLEADSFLLLSQDGPLLAASVKGAKTRTRLTLDPYIEIVDDAQEPLTDADKWYFGGMANHRVSLVRAVY